MTGASAAGTRDRQRGPWQGVPGEAQSVPPSSAISRMRSEVDPDEGFPSVEGCAQPAAVATGVADALTTSTASRGVSRTIGRNALGIVMESGRSQDRTRSAVRAGA